jgi:hypothetical protein
MKVQFGTASGGGSGDDVGMNHSAHVIETPLVNERLWQAWQLKNRELDRLSALRTKRFLAVALALAFASALLWDFLR